MRHSDPSPSPVRRRVALASLLSFALLAAPAPVLAAHHHAHVADDPDDFGWALFDGESNSMSGPMDDEVQAELEAEERASGAPLLWLRVDGAEWVVRDRALVRRADGILRPMRELGRQMGQVASEQGRIASRQGALAGRRNVGSEMGELGHRMGAMGRRMGAMGRRMGELSRRADREMRGLAREAISARRAGRLGDDI